MRHRAISLTALMITLPLLGGCLLRGPGDVKREVAANTGARYDREFGLTVGRLSLAIARTVVKHSEEQDIPPLKGIRKVQVGVYQVLERPDDGAGGGRGLRAADFPDWFPMAEVTPEDDEAVLVLTRFEGPEIRRMLVVVDERDELIIVRVKGKLTTFLEHAVRFAFEQADRPYLADPALADMERRRPAGEPSPEIAELADAS